MFGVCCFGVRCVFVLRCLLFAASRLLMFALFSALCVVRDALLAVGCLLIGVVCCFLLLLGVRCLLFVVWHFVFVVRRSLVVVRCLLLGICFLFVGC